MNSKSSTLTNCMLSVIVPAYNEEEVLPIFHARLVAALANTLELEGNWEVVYVNDGSKDGTLRILKELQQHEEREVRQRLLPPWRGAA